MLRLLEGAMAAPAWGWRASLRLLALDLSPIAGWEVCLSLGAVTLFWRVRVCLAPFFCGSVD